jgi:hypothetical protein
MARSRNFGTGTPRLNEGIILSGAADSSTVDFDSDGIADAVTLIVSGALSVSGAIFHMDDPDTFIQYYDDEIRIEVGGKQMIKLSEAGTDKIVINNGQVDIDLQIKSKTNANVFRTDANNNNVYFGANSGAGDDNNFFVSGTTGHKNSSSGSIAVIGGDLVVSGVMYAMGGLAAGEVLGIAAGDDVDVDEQFYIGVNTAVGAGTSHINLPGITSLGSGRIIWVADVGGAAGSKNIQVHVGNDTLDRITGDAGADTSFTQDSNGDINAWISYYDPAANGSTVFHYWFKMIP